MNPSTVATYFVDMRAAARGKAAPVTFYCCNRERKTLPDGTVTRILDYPWTDDDAIQVDEICPWHRTYYSRTPPFYHPYDGPIRHWLVDLAAAR